MKTYKINILLMAVAAITFFTSCEDWLTEPSPAVTELADYVNSGKSGIYVTYAAYAPLMWEYNGTYYSDFFIGDVMSDDALKGGQNISDMADVYDMENFKTISNNGYLLDVYRGQYQGVARCNLALREVASLETDSTMNISLQNRLLGELKYLRATYYFRLVRIFGGVPKVDFVIETASDWQQQRASTDTIYALILADLEEANTLLWKKSAYASEDLGRATKGAAQAMLLKVNLYTKNYREAEKWGDSITTSGEYALHANYADNFYTAGENGIESVFEVQYTADPTSDYGQGNGFTRGTFTTILTRSRSSLLGGGWGFNKPTQSLYNEFEVNDLRRDACILNPTDDQIENPVQEIYLGSRYLNRKTGYYDANGAALELDHPSRGPLNKKEIRYADVLLMHAEACCENGNLVGAKKALEIVRDRADTTATRTVLPTFPNYNGYTDNKEDLRKAIRHERRVELAMEGHRWYDICRWGIAKEVMDAYKAGETPEARAEMADFIAGKHELFPIPSKEIDLNAMPQNPQY
ncbi:MAG: RagB/SusD family nutrient uptake outer membrane protein [Bacteroidales bacterium]|jgi:hypothetical protein|nr:RagB/SusD family nutrient uptake outer membrane protein [Bacteroidales bacterium]